MLDKYTVRIRGGYSAFIEADDIKITENLVKFFIGDSLEAVFWQSDILYFFKQDKEKEEKDGN